MKGLKLALIASLALHGAFLYIMANGIPGFSRSFPTPERPIPIEIKTIDDITRVKQPEAKPEPEREEPKPQAVPERRKPKPDTQSAVPNPDLAPKPKPDESVVERKRVVENVTPMTKPRAPTSFDAGEISALIDRSIKDKPPEQRTNREKAIEDAVENAQLQGLEARQATASIEDYVRARMRECWSVPGGAKGIENMRVTLSFRLSPDGYVQGAPKIEDQGRMFQPGNEFFRAVAESAARAVRLCEPYELPKEHYNLWKELELTFDPSDMVG